MEISRTEQKRRAKEMEALVAEMVSLPRATLVKAPCPSEMISLMTEAAALQGGARKRLIKYVTKMLRREPAEELYAFVTAQRGKELLAKKQFHELEYLRNALVDEAIEQYRACEERGQPWDEDWSSTVAAEIGRQLPGIDLPALLRLAHVFARTRNPRHSREIFRLLRAAREQAD